MKKLIELLKNWDGRNITYNKQSDGGYMFWLEDLAFREERICSKKFGFIKWLVDNKKIDFTKDCIVEFGPWNTEWYCDKYDNILMNLAIEDNPIKFLISILK